MFNQQGHIDLLIHLEDTNELILNLLNKDQMIPLYNCKDTNQLLIYIVIRGIWNEEGYLNDMGIALSISTGGVIHS